MQKFKRRQRHSLPFGLFLAVMGALLLPAAVAPRANAGSTDYWDSEDPLGLRARPAPELFSQPQGVLINQPLASNYNPNLALNVAPGDQPGGVQPLVPDANASWTGATNTTWSTAGNWTAGGPPNNTQIASFNGTFSNMPNVTASTQVGELIMTDPVGQNVTLSSNAGAILTIFGVGGQGILINNTNAFTLTITARLALNATQTWTNNSGNLFTVSGTTLNLGDGTVLTVNGTGNTTIFSVISDTGMGGAILKAGSGTLTLETANTYTQGTTVNGGTLLVNNSVLSGTGTGAVTVNNAGSTLGGTGIITGTVSVGAGANIAPGNPGSVGTLTTGALTLAANSNFQVDINGTAGTSDRINVATGAANITNSNLVVTVVTTVSLNQTFTILSKTAAGAITGTFAGIPQGGTVVGSDGSVFQVSYIGGDGNDITLTVLAVAPEPSTWMGGALAIAGLAFTQRRRLRKLIARRCAVGSS